MLTWYTFTTSHSANPPQTAFGQLWQTRLFRSPDACLFAGGTGIRGQRHYLALPEGAEDRVQEFLSTYRAQRLQGVPEDTEVSLLVGHPERAAKHWEERITCSRENPEGCVMCSG